MELAAYEEVEALNTLPAHRTSNMISSKLGQILVVDDEVELKNALVEMLNAQGFDALGCASGEDALSALRKQNFDVLLSDLMMPEMDGVTLLGKALKIDQHLVCIIMTGQGTIQTAIDAMKVGAFDYVLKPFRLQALLPVLTRAINVRRLNQENLQLRETVAIHELCQTISFTLDPQTVLSKLADAAQQQSEADEVSILLPTDDGRELYVAAVRGENRERLLGERIPLELSISSWVARERLPLLLEGQVNDVRFKALWPRSEISSAILVPMQIAGKLVGIININTVSSPRPFTLGQMKALTILASTAAAALESASLYVQVRQAEEKYRLIFDNAVEGIFQSSLEGRFITVNPALARILGYDSPEEVCETITDITHQLYVDPARQAEATRLLEEQDVLQGFEFEAYRKDGEKIWLSANRRAVRSGSGVELYWEGSLEDITEYKQAAAALQASEERYRDLVENARDIIYTHDLEGNYTSINKACERITGYTREETLSLSLKQAVAPEYLEKARWITSGKLMGEEGKFYDLEIIAKDGHRIAVEVNARMVFQDDVPVGVQGIARDITERKQAEARLRESEEKYRSIVETANEGICLINAEACASFVNQQMATMLGYTVAEMLGRPVLDFIFPADSAAAELKVAQFQQNASDTGEFRLRRKDGSAVVTLYNATPTKDQAGEVVGFLSMFIDITERKRAEEELFQSEQRYRLLFERNPQPMWVFDLETLAFLEVNNAAIHHYGYAREEFLAMTIKDIRPAEDVPALLDNVSRYRPQLEEAGIWKHKKKDGTTIDVEITAHELTFYRRPAQLVLAYDVTERRSLEEQLRQSQKLEAVGQLAGGVAHDFNNLLTVITGYSDLSLRRLDKDNPIRPNLEEIKKAGERAASLTRQLLAFSRKQVLQPKALKLNVIVDDVNKMLRRLIGEDIELLTMLEPGLGQIRADPGQIEQVILNLSLNARDAMPQGGKLTIETANVYLDDQHARRHTAIQPGHYVMLAVSDNGCGIDAKIQARMFEPFFTTKEQGKGTGLGLSTVYGIVTQSGGHLWVYSEVGKGTTFKVYLPRVDEVVESKETRDTPVEIRQGQETVLVTEDEEQVRQMIRMILEMNGYHVLEASSGDEALAIYKQHEGQIDLIMTDVVMPQMSGRELAQSLEILHPNIKVLYMSGYTTDAIVRHGLLEQEIAFLQKPFAPDALIRKVREVLDAPQQG
ncbi:MAG: two-component system, cell cycle sensor histidine kinase and response regulator CckA [Acidobacteriota bacterium]|jgi:PAS domain S-box-containing protein|nr:two-component system, cell cycle sensor histidine kinase and response regulator CckA [Acidobacteriota bacterium]